MIFLLGAFVLKIKKGITFINDFQGILDTPNYKLKKIWTRKCSEFYNRSMKSWLQGYGIEMYSKHNAGKQVDAA